MRTNNVQEWTNREIKGATLGAVVPLQGQPARLVEAIMLEEEDV